MVKNIISVLLLTISVSTVATPIEEIYRNRSHIIGLYNCIDNGNSIDSIECHDNRSNCYLSNLKDSIFTIWEKNEKDIIEYFIKFVPNVSKRYKRYNFYISDTVVIKILASLLDYPFKAGAIKPYSDNPQLIGSPLITKGNWNHEALLYLTCDTYFPYLKKYSEKILSHLEKCPESIELKMGLMSLCSLPEGESKKILSSYDNKQTNTNALLPWIRIRLGDTLTENKLIIKLKEFQRVPNFSQKEYSNALYFATNGIYSGSDSALYYVFKLFEKISFSNNDRNGNETQFCRSLQDSLIFLIARLHPDTPLFQNRLHMLTNPRDYCDIRKQENYFIDFQKWLKNTYRYIISYNGFIPVFERLCDTSLTIQYCK